MCISNEKGSISKYLSSSFSQFNPAQKPKAQKIIIDLSILESGSTVLAFDNSLYSKYILSVGEIMKASLEHNSSAHILLISAFHGLMAEKLYLSLFVVCSFVCPAMVTPDQISIYTCKKALY